MRNLSSGVLPSDVVSDIGQRMTEIKDEIKALEATEPPEDYTVDTIRQWLNALKNNPDEKAVKLLIKRIDVSGDKNNNVFNIQSTLNTLLEIVVRVVIQNFFEKASNINGFQGGRVANNLYISPFWASVFQTAALFLYPNSSVVIRVENPCFLSLWLAL